MKTTVTKIVSMTLGMARVTATVMGLAVLLAVVFGFGTTALAAVPGDPFKLGRINTLGKLTQLAGSVDGAMLRIENDSKGADASALELQVNPTKPPMKVDSFTRVEKLNADLLDGQSADQFVSLGGTAFNSNNLDGKDSTSFFSGNTYLVTETRKGVGFGSVFSKTAFCDEGDSILGGGLLKVPEDDLVLDAPASVGGTTENWTVVVKDNGEASEIKATAVCADFPPLRP